MTMMSGAGGGGGVMGAGNPVVGGTTLRIPAIQSPNYVHGVSGWAVFADGTAEFAGLTIDGGTLVMGGSGEVLLYTGTPAAGNLFAVMAPVAGTDAFANSWPAGITLFGSDGSQLSQQVQANRAMMKVTPPTQAGITWTPGLIEGFYGAPYPPAPVQLARGALALLAPVDAAAGDGAGITIFGGVAAATPSQVLQQSDSWWVLADTFNLIPNLTAAVAAVIKGTLSVATSLQVASQPARLCAGSVQNTSSVGPFTAETVTDQITVNAVDGRTYRIEYRGNFFSSVAGDVITVRLREDTVTGTQLDSTDASMAAANRSYKQVLGMEWTAPAGSTGVPKTFVVTGVRTAGTGNITRQANATIPKALLTVDQVSL